MPQHPYNYADFTYGAHGHNDPRPLRRSRRPAVVAVGALVALLLVPVAADRFATRGSSPVRPGRSGRACTRPRCRRSGCGASPS
jgi:hypothetical protein